MEDKQPKKETIDDEFFINFLTCLMLFSLVAYPAFAAVILWNIWPIDKTTVQQAGSFGDSFGALTSLFSCLTLTGLLITIKLQRDSNKQQQVSNELQRQELSNTREEMKRTADAQAQQSATLKLQQFENTFFKLIELFQQHRQDGKKHNIHVINTINELHHEISFEKEEIIFDGRGIPYSLFTDCLKAEYTLWENVESMVRIILEKNRLLIQPWFSQVENILELIEQSPIQDKALYLKIFMSQLNPEEHAMLFYLASVEDSGFELFGLHRYKKFTEYLDTNKIFNEHLEEYIKKSANTP